MNRRIKTIVITMCAIMLACCQSAPKIVAELEGNYPARLADSVMVYEVGESVPAEAKVIGKVKVTDGGLTPTYKCLYGNMLALAIKKTAESGGNALRIDEHKKPASFGSTCHRIWGTMMLVPDSLVNCGTTTSLQEIEMNKDKELADMTRGQISKVEKLFNNPYDILRMSIGPGWITSEIEASTSFYKSVYKRKVGFSGSADYLHFWRYGFGLGANYQFYWASFDEGFDISMHYVGPCVAYGLNFGNRWRMDMTLGLGYTYFTESYRNGANNNQSASQSRLGFSSQLGIEYKVSEKVGLALQMNGFSVSLKRPEDIDTDKYDFWGIKHIDAQLGFRIYL